VKGHLWHYQVDRYKVPQTIGQLTFSLLAATSCLQRLRGMTAFYSTIPFYASWNGRVTAYILPYFVWGSQKIHLKSDSSGNTYFLQTLQDAIGEQTGYLCTLQNKISGVELLQNDCITWTKRERT
jgi:hypothetical protein